LDETPQVIDILSSFSRQFLGFFSTKFLFLAASFTPAKVESRFSLSRLLAVVGSHFHSPLLILRGFQLRHLAIRLITIELSLWVSLGANKAVKFDA
jgi:hypothetical protein